MSMVGNMRDWLQQNRNEEVGTLSSGERPHEQYAAQTGEQLPDEIKNAFEFEMLTRQPCKGVLGSQAYRYLRMAVLQNDPDTDLQDWPNYRL